MVDNDIHDLVIVGGGPGGLTAAIYAMRAAMKTVLIEKSIPGGQMAMTDDVENYPGFERIGGAELSMKFAEHAQAFGLEIVSQEVVAVVPGIGHHTVKLADGTAYKTHAVVIGTGGSPRKLNVPGEDDYYGQGVSYCGVCDGFFFRGKTVVVVGGGDTAVEEALYLSKLAKQVYVVHRRDALRAGMILQQRLKNDCNAEILWNSVVTEIHAGDNGVNAVTLKDTRTEETRELATDGVFIFVGYNPNNQLVPEGTRMNPEGYVVTDDKCETSTPGIYVIGDLREKYAKQVILAAADGCLAALAAAHYVETRKAQAADSCELPAEE
jgi:thioredoxin reductase (NADPH)